jgi:hypothetical protein
MNVFLVFMIIVSIATRLHLLTNLWRLPLKNGDQFFLSQQVEAGFYREMGAPLFRRYRLAVLAPLVLDAPLALWLVATHKLTSAFFEQWLAIIGSILVYRLMVVYFSAQAGNTTGHKEVRPTVMQLSMSPRRLGDHTNFQVELAVGGSALLALGLFAHSYALAAPAADGHGFGNVVRQAGFLTWILYLQVGLLLLKVVYVRWRMPLPVNRTGDFRRWRAAWLRWHLTLLDSIRLLWALGMVWGVVRMIYWESWSRSTAIIALSAWVVPIGLYFVHVSRESRRFKAVERDVRPIELIKEFPKPPVPDGRFVAGGLLYFNRDNPRIVVRSPAGVAVNLAHWAPYVWVGYLIGLALLTMWRLR